MRSLMDILGRRTNGLPALPLTLFAFLPLVDVRGVNLEEMGWGLAIGIVAVGALITIWFLQLARDLWPRV
jgi:hypothetical protein